MLMSRWYFLALAALPLLLRLLHPAPQPGLMWWTTHSLEKIHPSDAEPANPARVAKIHAARNEFEPFQLALRAQGQDLNAVDVEVSDLRSNKGIIPADQYITVYLEQFLDLAKPSSLTGGTGEWPDPLVPRMDRYANEKRNAFPFKLTTGRTQPIWIDVFVPPSAAAGTYLGEVRVSTAGQTKLTVPIELEVWNFELPSTSSLATAFGFSGNAAVRAHYGRYRDDKDVTDMTYLYSKAALLHRISLDGSASVLPVMKMNSGKLYMGWDEYDRLVTPFMTGRVLTGADPLSGAKATSVAIHTPPLMATADQQVEFWRQISEHFRQKGWFAYLINYLWDEPKSSSFAQMAELGRTVHRADPEVRNLVTAPFHSDWSDFINIWTPPINCFERKPHESDFCDPMVERVTYDPELAKGKELWWYQACGSHGCNVIGGEYFRGWPSYMIDDAPVRNRIMEWLTWKYGIHGELYYSMDEAFARKPDPWKDVNLFAGNGDGTLFYPGKPQVIGGTKHIPIESIRLKLIREGLEDYEYLALLTKIAGYKEVSDGITGLMRSTYDYDQDPSKLIAAREWLAREIIRRSGK